MRRIVMPVLLLALALASLIGANYLNGQLQEDLGEVADDDTVPPSVGTPLVSTRRLTAMLAPPLTEPGFFNALDEMMASAPPSACLSVTLGKNAYYESNANIAVMPADAVLLLTLAAAHKELGPDHTFITSVQSVVSLEDGVVNGDIYLVGGGDPLLLTREFAATLGEGENRLRTPIEDLAQDLVDGGLALVTGAVVGDAARYDDLLYVGSWPETMIRAENLGTLQALQFDDGWVEFPSTAPAEEEGDAGREAPEETADEQLAAEDPPFYAAALFDDMLEAEDVVIRRSPRSEGFPADEEAFVLASIESAPLSAYYRQILDNRDAETAELLLKEIGLATSGTGSTRAGTRAVQTVLAGVGVDEEFQFLQFDGSGRDPANVATCPLFTALLDSEEFSPFFHDLLPTAAEAAPSRVDDPERLKVLSGGASNTAVTLGYVDIGLGQELTFAFIANQPDPAGSPALLELAERILSHLATLEAKPSLDDIQLEEIRAR